MSNSGNSLFHDNDDKQGSDFVLRKEQTTLEFTDDKVIFILIGLIHTHDLYVGVSISITPSFNDLEFTL